MGETPHVLLDDDDGALIELGRKLFAQECTFINGSLTLDTIPEPSLPEIAFAGRSNVGKSSLLNALTGRTSLARTSNTPGRTQQLNFFNLGRRLMLVDMPGYGYAEAPKTEIRRWTKLIELYLKGRPNLRRACVLIDARHGLKETDAPMLKMLDAAAVTYQIVLTKCDKLKASELSRRMDEIAETIRRHPAAFPKIWPTSSEDGTGIAELRAALTALAEPAPVG